MSAASPEFAIGQRVSHTDLGEGIVTALTSHGYVTVFFGPPHGMRQVQSIALQSHRSREETILDDLRPATPEALTRLWLMLEAAQIPLLEEAGALTSAKIDLLPHQVVLTHRVAQSSPRRFLVADEVGLGKTVETALVLRELASRGQLQRALMVVPAGLVENWRRELNDIFHLDFEVFGSEGDVTDRKTNAFARHDRMIASIDTLKRTARVARLLEAPHYDLIVFDEAHHLTATRTGRKVSKTENFKLAEALRDHTRDLLLLSATPHQGDHFRFWMLIRLLDPAMFTDEQDMLANRHRLNAFVMRRTKADACSRDGSPLFARRQVHTHVFALSDVEQQFYEALRRYIIDGYNLAEEQGNAGRALGFVMTIFQKLAASSFAAVRLTLERRLLMLTLHESIVCEQRMDIDGRDNALTEARAMIQDMQRLGNTVHDQAQIESLLADARLQLMKRLRRHDDIDPDTLNTSEIMAVREEDSASTLVSLALPEERRRIHEVLAQFPPEEETKARNLVQALREIWFLNPKEKIVIFTTYLGSVDLFRHAIETAFPQAGVEVLKGGDHGAKTAAERRFRHPNGPRVMISTAAGREGINLQFARVLFNADLPWNPMDLEQRIGRIHRYGQQHTAQVYNLVVGDTIEGKIFLLLEQKVDDIAKALGKVDETGQVAEDLRAQILGQLSERLSYDRLYQEGLRDPTLQRTRLELEAALRNAQDARYMVQELFQDLDGFRLEEYHEMDDQGQSIRRLLQFVMMAAQQQGYRMTPVNETTFSFTSTSNSTIHLTTDREQAMTSEDLDLAGLEQPWIAKLLSHYAQLYPNGRALAVQAPDDTIPAGAVTIWYIVIQGKGGLRHERIIWLGVTAKGDRSKHVESLAVRLRELHSAQPILSQEERSHLMATALPAIMQRALAHSGMLTGEATYGATLLGWVEVNNR